MIDNVLCVTLVRAVNKFLTGSVGMINVRQCTLYDSGAYDQYVFDRLSGRTCLVCLTSFSPPSTNVCTKPSHVGQDYTKL